MNKDHECVRSSGNKQAKFEWLAKKFIPLIRHTPHIKPSGLAYEALERWNVKLNNSQAYRDKKRATELLEGPGNEQYAYLNSYVKELRRKNHNSTVIIKCETLEIWSIFERIYIFLKACKATFTYARRPLIGLDAFFLKGDYGGQLIAVVVKDENNQMIPIAYVLVESETRDSCKFFFYLLLEDLKQIMPIQYAFISD